MILVGVSGGVGGDLDDVVGIEGHADPFQQRDGGHYTTCFQAGQRGLGHAGAGGQFDLGQAQGLAAFADGLADQNGPAGLSVSLTVLLAAAPGPAKTGYGSNWVLAAVIVRLPAVRRLVAIPVLAKLVIKGTSSASAVAGPPHGADDR